MKQARGWLLLMCSLPTRSGTARVAVWRKLRKLGAQAINTGAHVLPGSREHHENFQWLAQEIQKAGGTAHVVATSRIEGLSDAALRRRFERACDAVYEELIERAGQASDASELADIRAEATEGARVDFFNSRKAAQLEKLLRRAVPASRAKRLSRARYRGKRWVTRPRPHIDRIACAWLIKRFIDPKARFDFAPEGRVPPGAIPYDMAGVEFTHQGEDCSFETLIRRFGIRDPAVGTIAEIVHDADLKDDKFGRPEWIGLDAVIRGLTDAAADDRRVLERGMTIFDALYARLKKR